MKGNGQHELPERFKRLAARQGLVKVYLLRGLPLALLDRVLDVYDDLLDSVHRLGTIFALEA